MNIVPVVNGLFAREFTTVGVLRDLVLPAFIASIV